MQISGITTKKAEKLLDAANEFLKITQPKDPQAENQETEEEKTAQNETLGEALLTENEAPVE
jgi:Holliday junction resolvasome RuvABC DNA-binding subunit